MIAEITIYVARPATERGPWRITCGQRPVEERSDRENALDYAVAYARVVEAAGRAAVVKIERPDGTWVVYGGRGRLTA